MKKNGNSKWDLKSFITIEVITGLVVVFVMIIGAVVFGFLPADAAIVGTIITLFSSISISIVTYYFTRPKKKDEDQEDKDET